MVDLKCGDYIKGRKVIEIYKDPFTKIDRARVEGTVKNWQGDKSDISYAIKDLNDKDIKKIYTAEIKMKLPSLNEYIKSCNSSRYKGNQMKQDIQEQIYYFIKDLPKFEKPVRINFLWIESNKRRDLDNICFAKKFILDTLVNYGKLQNDNRKNVYAFTDEFDYGKENKVILAIEEQENEENN